MRNYAALVRRELGVYFVSPLAYIILTAFLLVSGYFFVSIVIQLASARQAMNYGIVQSVMVNLLTLMSPLITMRLIAEEKSRGTIETIMTAPISEWQFVLAKFSAALLFVGYLILPSICYAILAGRVGTVDLGAAAAGYFGMLLAIGAVLAIGTFISALCANQITAGVLTLVTALALIAMPFIAPFLPREGAWETVRDVFEHINLLGHMEEFSRGIIDTKSVVFLGSAVFLSLFLTVRAVESRRWR